MESYLDKCIEWFQKALKFFAKQETFLFFWDIEYVQDELQLRKRMVWEFKISKT